MNKEHPELDGQLILNVHDELVFDFNTVGVKESLLMSVMERIKRLMEAAGSNMGSGLVTPVDVSRVDKRWSESIGVAL